MNAAETTGCLMTVPERTPKEIIAAILANLEMAYQVSIAAAKATPDDKPNTAWTEIGKAQAFTEAIRLIHTETKDMQ